MCCLTMGIHSENCATGMSNPWPTGCMQRRMAMNMAQHKIVNLLKTFFLLIKFH